MSQKRIEYKRSPNSIGAKFGTTLQHVVKNVLQPAVSAQIDAEIIITRRAKRSKRGKVLTGIADLQTDFESDHQDNFRDKNKLRDVEKHTRARRSRISMRGYRGKFDAEEDPRERKERQIKFARRRRQIMGTDHKTTGFNVAAAVARFNRTGKLPSASVETVRAAIVGPVGDARAMIEAMLMRSGIEPNPGMDDMAECVYAGKYVRGEWVHGVAYCPQCSKKILQPQHNGVGLHPPKDYEEMRQQALESVNRKFSRSTSTSTSTSDADDSDSPPTKEIRRQERIAGYQPREKYRKPRSGSSTPSFDSPRYRPLVLPENPLGGRRPPQPLIPPVPIRDPPPAPAPGAQVPIALSDNLANFVTRYGDFRIEIKNSVTWMDWFALSAVFMLCASMFLFSLAEWSSKTICFVRALVYGVVYFLRFMRQASSVSLKTRMIIDLIHLPAVIMTVIHHALYPNLVSTAIDQLMVFYVCAVMCERMYPTGRSEDWRNSGQMTYRMCGPSDDEAIDSGHIRTGFVATNVVGAAVQSVGELLPSQRALEHSTLAGLRHLTRRIDDVGPNGRRRISNQHVVISSALVKLLRSRINCTLGNTYERVVLDLMRYAENQNSVQLPPDNDVSPIPITLATVHYVADQLFSVPANLNAGAACFY